MSLRTEHVTDEGTVYDATGTGIMVGDDAGSTQNLSELLDLPFDEVLQKHPLATGFFDEVRVEVPAAGCSIASVIDSMDQFALSDCGMSASALKEYFVSYLSRMEGISSRKREPIRSITILGGRNKDGAPEDCTVKVGRGEVLSIVGPTGSGKSRLLEDIGYLAQGDTPTGRRILIDGEAPSVAMRLSVENRVVAELSQSMVFIMDLPVRDFLRLHATSRMMSDALVEKTVDETIECANGLAGEPFDPDTKLTVLSGGQSRALMIADLAFISISPIVLIDEIENAGVDRMRALELLISRDKIVFVVTHDPLIAIMGDRRLVISNGGIARVVEPCAAERRNIPVLHGLDEKIVELRRRVRMGEQIDLDVGSFLASPMRDGGRMGER